MKIILFSALVPLLILLGGCSPAMTRTYIDPSDIKYEVSANTEIIDEEAMKEAVKVIEKNLTFAENEDINGYLSTIAKSDQNNTKSELTAFFRDYDLEHTILSVNVLDQEQTRMLIEVKQQTVLVEAAEGAEDYRDHVSIANHTIIMENNEWKISETIMTETFFIE